MIQIIMGLKGSGKTKRLINAINEAVTSAQGDVVCIEYGKKLSKAQAEELLVSLGFAANVRGEALSLKDYAAIAAKLHEQFAE